MIDRRAVLTRKACGILLAAAVLLMLPARPLASSGQQAPKLVRIGVLLPGPQTGAYNSRIDAFKRGLREYGYEPSGLHPLAVKEKPRQTVPSSCRFLVGEVI